MTGIGGLRQIHDSIGDALFGGGSSETLRTVERVTNNVVVPLMDASSRMTLAERGIPSFSRANWGHPGFGGPHFGHRGFGGPYGHHFPGMRHHGGPSNIPRYMQGGFRGGFGNAIGMTRSPGQGLVGMDRNGNVISSRNGQLGSVGGLGEAYDACGRFIGGGAPDGTIYNRCNQPIGYVAESGHIFNRCNEIVGRLDIPGGMRGEHAAAYALLSHGNQLQ